MDITQKLFELQDIPYRDFQMKLIPGQQADSFIGVRTPALRSLAKELINGDNWQDFAHTLPHRYFDENQLHAMILSQLGVFNIAAEEVENFLPYVDNWATCDQLRPKAFRKDKQALMAMIRRWIASDRTFTVRFATGMLMCHFLDDDFSPEILDLAASVRSQEYYINMMTAWFFATALAKQYTAALPYITERRLDPWVHAKTIQKARESYRISAEQKSFLLMLK